MVTVLAADDVLVDAAPAFAHPRAQVGAHLFVGRQGIFGRGGAVHGYEFLYRAGRQHTLRVDQWTAQAQDRATLRVLQATFGPSGVRSVASDALVFVNFSRSFPVSYTHLRAHETVLDLVCRLLLEKKKKTKKKTN